MYYKLTGSGGARFDSVHKLGSRSWDGNHLTGKLADLGNKHSMGYGLHLDSSLNNSKTQVFIEPDKIRYVIVDMKTNKEIKEYTQNI